MEKSGSTLSIPTEISDEKVRLRREFGLFQGVSVIVGLVIGTGIYIAPTGVLREVPSAGVALIIWAIAGIISTLGALTFAEIGTTIPVAGEKYAYLRVMFGEFLAFLQLWQYFLLVRPSSNIIKGWVFAMYILKPVFPDCDVPRSVVILIAICLVGAITFINCINVRLSARVQSFFSSMTVVTLTFVITVSLIFISKGKSQFLQPEYTMSASQPITTAGIVLGLYSAMYTYSGWFALNFMIEELKNPYKNLPRAIIISMSTVCVIYILVNIGYLAVLGVEGIVNSEAVVVSFGALTLGTSAIYVLAVVIAFNTLGSLNSGILVGSRLAFAGARNGHLPKVLSLIQMDHRSPAPALILQWFMAMIMCASDDIFVILNQTMFMTILFNLFTTIGMIRMRYTEPDRHRPLKLPIAIPVIYGLSQFFMIVIALYTSPKKVGIGLLVVLATAIPYYLIFFKNIVRIRPLERLSNNILILVQKSIVGVPQED